MPVLIVLQIMCLLVLFFGDIGFDHPGKFGLSFNHGVFFMFLYALSLVCGIAVSLCNRGWLFLFVQLLLCTACIANQIRSPDRIDPASVQHLLGKESEIITRVLGSRNLLTGAQTYRGILCEVYDYPGVTFFVDQEQKIIAIVPNNR